jgi:hypothetical protein
MTKANGNGVILEYADLTDAILDYAKFPYSFMKHATLSGAQLTNVIFKGADLSSAKLDNANLIYAYFVGSDMRYANIRGANLIGATFYNTKIDNIVIGAYNPESDHECKNKTTLFDERNVEYFKNVINIEECLVYVLELKKDIPYPEYNKLRKLS